MHQFTSLLIWSKNLYFQVTKPTVDSQRVNYKELWWVITKHDGTILKTILKHINFDTGLVCISSWPLHLVHHDTHLVLAGVNNYIWSSRNDSWLQKTDRSKALDSRFRSSKHDGISLHIEGLIIMILSYIEILKQFTAILISSTRPQLAGVKVLSVVRYLD